LFLLYNTGMRSNSHHKRHTIWLVGGGTGGHIIPLLAVAEILKDDPSVSLTYLGDENGPEYTLARQAGLPFLSVPTGKLRRYFSPSAFFLNIRDIFRLLSGVILSYRFIKQKRPRVIFSKGGPAALPVALAAYLTSTRLITHESDSAMGMTNWLIGTFARTVLTAFPASVYPSRFAGKIISVGVPIRRDFCHTVRRATGRGRPMILITGASQGSVAINEAMAAILPQLLQHTSVMHITGALSHKRFLALKAQLPPKLSDHYGVIDFTSAIADYMREADVIVSRSGSTIFEIASLGKPMILIPLPTSANDHQRKNAEWFVKANAAVMIAQSHLTPTLLYETIMTVLEDAKLRAELKEGTRSFSSCNAARQVATLLKEYADEDVA
jgi:UDP-N-acetylglucosamine--N-acetylmuramyl-(pentapeptide) pyrophosphoryl-undecaprenol N-acetylglucosamine transferase